MDQNGPGYRSKLHRKACEAMGIRHLFTRPYRPRTNGKAERFIRTLLDSWAYKRPYATSPQRRAALPAFITRYNTQRPHRSLSGQTPTQRLAERNKTAAAFRYGHLMPGAEGEAALLLDSYLERELSRATTLA